MRLARLKHEVSLFVDYEPRIAPKGTIVQVHDNPPSQHLYCCVIPGYPQDCYIRPIYLELLDETGKA